MFVRWIDENGMNSLYQCDGVIVEHLVADSGDKDDNCLMVRLQRDGVDAISLIMRQKQAKLYIMNDNGKTIDSFRWSGDVDVPEGVEVTLASYSPANLSD
jgi:hypothetical protein